MFYFVQRAEFTEYVDLFCTTETKLYTFQVFEFKFGLISTLCISSFISRK